VRVKRALSYGAYSALQARLGAGALAASAQTKNESAADVARIFLAEFDRLATEKLAADDVAKRIAFTQGGFARQAETSSGLAAILGGLALQGVPAAEVTRYLDRVGAVTADAASASAAATVSGAGATLIVVGDAAKFLEPLKTLRGDVTVVPVSALRLDALP
jgi:zinc protease